MGPWRKRLLAHLLPMRWGPEFAFQSYLASFHGSRIVVWAGFSRGFSRFCLPQMSFLYLYELISCTIAMMRQAWSVGIFVIHRPLNIWTSTHDNPRPTYKLDTSSGIICVSCIRVQLYMAQMFVNFSFNLLHSMWCMSDSPGDVSE